MKIFKYFILGSLVVFSLVLSSVALAATPPVHQKPTFVVVANVNIQDAVITSQKDNVLSISFLLSNGKGLQTGVKYGVKLISEVGKKQAVVDEKIYPESLTLPENSHTKKEITYTAPSSLAGAYTVLLTSNNTSGFPFGLTVAGKVTLVPTTKGLEIDASSCSTKIEGDTKSIVHPLLQTVSIDSTESIRLTCTATNSKAESVTATPYYQTTYRSAYGETIEATGGDASPVLFGPLEKKTFSVVLPKANKPQLYSVSVVLGAGDTVSNRVSTQYVVRGPNATIINLSFDKDYYQKGDKAKLVFLWTSSNTKNVSLKIALEDDRGTSCASTLSYHLSDDTKVDFPALIKESCFNPQAVLSLVDDKGTLLDEKTFNVQTKSLIARPHTLPDSRVLWITGVILLIIFLIIMRKRKNKKDGAPYVDGVNTVSLKIVLPLLIVLSSLFISHSVSAATLTLSDASGDTTVVANIDRSAYTPGQNIYASASITSSSPNIQSVYVQGSVNGSAYVDIIGTTAIYQNQTLSTPASPINIGSAGAPGSYTASYSAGANYGIDVCLNISGLQTTIPAGLTDVGGATCWTYTGSWTYTEYCSDGNGGQGYPYYSQTCEAYLDELGNERHINCTESGVGGC